MATGLKWQICRRGGFYLFLNRIQGPISAASIHSLLLCLRRGRFKPSVQSYNGLDEGVGQLQRRLSLTWSAKTVKLGLIQSLISFCSAAARFWPQSWLAVKSHWSARTFPVVSHVLQRTFNFVFVSRAHISKRTTGMWSLVLTKNT